jgi:hypothetical protein
MLPSDIKKLLFMFLLDVKDKRSLRWTCHSFLTLQVDFVSTISEGLLERERREERFRSRLREENCEECARNCLFIATCCCCCTLCDCDDQEGD